MARTIAQINKQITDMVAADATLSTRLTSISKTAVWRLQAFIVASAIWVLEVLYDSHKQEVAAMLAAKKVHTLGWYVDKAKAFQYDNELPPDTDVYPVISEEPDVRIVTQAAAIEHVNRIRLKVAKDVSGEPGPLNPTELAAFKEYMGRVKDAGVRLEITTDDADNVRVWAAVYYDPLVLNAAGERLDGTATTPVMDAIKEYLKNLPFNGLFVVNKLTDAIELVPGVRIGRVVNVEANYALTAWVPVPVEYTPNAGYLKLDETHFLANVTYYPHGIF